ncbi:MAG: fatty acid desaturase [Verrucomicrobiota bacterium]
MLRIPFERVNWVPSTFLIGTLTLTLTAVPAYIWFFGLPWYQVVLFFGFFILTGLSITFGYHRLFSHKAFDAKKSVKATCLVFGAAAFEQSALDWCSDHRRHHKHVDHDDDPYDISKGFMWAHIGWMLFKLKPKPPMDNVGDLRKDKLVMWQHRNWVWMGALVGFIIPGLIGGAAAALFGAEGGFWIGFLGGFLIGGVARVTAVQHCTFFINSLCHTVGNRPYSRKCSARDSWIMALFTFGEGYHNYHHEFQHDYRNGVKKWQFDPTKWLIWTLSKFGLTSKLRRVPDEKIQAAQEKVKEQDEAERKSGRIELKPPTRIPGSGLNAAD